jgi:hypothetical protein
MGVSDITHSAIGILFHRHSRHDAVAQPCANHAFDRLDAAKLHHRRDRYPLAANQPSISARVPLPDSKAISG